MRTHRWRDFWVGAAVVSLVFFGLAATYVDGVRRDIVSGEAGQFSAAYPLKATPVAADRILIEDSAASNAKAYSTITSMAGTLSPWDHGTGVGAVSTTEANDDVVPNAGTGTVGAAADFWDLVYAEEIGLGSADGAGVGGSWRGETIGGAQALSWFSAAGGATRRLAITENVRSVVFKNYFQVNGNGPAFRFDNNAALSGANDDIVEFYNGGAEKARIEFDGSIWTDDDLTVTDDINTDSGDFFSNVADGGIAYDFDTGGTLFTTGSLAHFQNNGNTVLNLEASGRLQLKTTVAPSKLRAGDSTDRAAWQLEATLNDGEAGSAAFIFNTTGTTLATVGDLLYRFRNNSGTKAELDYQGNQENAGYIDARGQKSTLVLKTADYTATLNDYTILVDTSTAPGAVTITLPDGTAGDDSMFTIKKIDSVTNYVIVATNGGDTIDDEASISLISKNQFVQPQSDGTDWYLLSQNLGDCSSDYLDANQTTEISTFEDVTGLSVDVVLQKAGVINVDLVTTCASSTGNASILAIAIEIDGVDRGEVHRYLAAGGTDTGSAASIARAELAAGTYTVQARFRRVSGTGVPQLNAGLCHIYAQACTN